MKFIKGYFEILRDAISTLWYFIFHIFLKPFIYIFIFLGASLAIIGYWTLTYIMPFICYFYLARIVNLNVLIPFQINFLHFSNNSSLFVLPNYVLSIIWILLVSLPLFYARNVMPGIEDKEKHYCRISNVTNLKEEELIKQLSDISPYFKKNIKSKIFKENDNTSHKYYFIDTSEYNLKKIIPKYKIEIRKLSGEYLKNYYKKYGFKYELLIYDYSWYNSHKH